jgi:hypothetical protein
MPHLIEDRQRSRVLMSWHEQTAPDRWALQMAERIDDRWTEPRTVARRDAFFVNWADFPSITALKDGSLLVHWLEKVAEGPYAYHVHLSLSRDGGETWSEPFVAHENEKPTEHGFVSVVPWEDGAALVWLDGRDMRLEALGSHGSEEAEGPADYGAMTLRARTVSADGTLGEEWLLDDRTCECCTTTLARTAHGIVAAYRDRSLEEIRDIYSTRFHDGSWSEPQPVHTDRWYLPGCPVNGPQLAADGDRVAVSWFTAADEQPGVYVVVSDDDGASWGDPIRVDEGQPLGRVDVELLADGAVAVSWIETSGDLPRVLLRGVGSDGAVGPAVVVTEISASRSSGFPRMTRAGDDLLVAWTAAGPEGGVRVRAVGVE